MKYKSPSVLRGPRGEWLATVEPLAEFQMFGERFVVHHTLSPNYSVSHAGTGAHVAASEPTKEMAIREAKALIKIRGSAALKRGIAAARKRIAKADK